MRTRTGTRRDVWACTASLALAMVLIGCGSATAKDPTPDETDPPSQVGAVRTVAARPSATPPPAGYATYIDALPYCAAVGTVDLPGNDPRYAGPEPPADITAILKAAPQENYARPTDYYSFRSWRCVQGEPYVCYGHGPATCELAETSAIPTNGMADFCRANPTFSLIPLQTTGNSSLYAWECVGGVARVRETIAKTDAQGFIETDWYPVVRGPRGTPTP